MDWLEIDENWVLVPPRPIAIVHFLGGAFIGAAPHVTYRWLLEAIATQGYIIVTTPFINTFDHYQIARSVLEQFNQTLTQLERLGKLRRRYLPLYGLGHSMGCKLHLIIGSFPKINHAGNIFIAYNNYPVNQSIPLGQELNLATMFQLEFTPSPEQTEVLIEKDYQIRRNLLIRFQNDNIDQSSRLIEILRARFANMVTLQRLPGNHLTPTGQDINWQAGREFSPLDAMGQWVKQEFIYKDITRLKAEILRWLNPGFSR
ncbi:DUF1350 family protein [Roseofilum reptotaenium CS-1145]|uniref:DUF1350 domain-containing protein n=1 Tax=Roseofilum reptotaenium AO1-A TaxID=1925591 RepID=A0A1L9QWG8_9CYAN|nr:DUF1350 family protein [Roseofilum reptotaenium]MDB9518592.1 DUF1350 family protein [Roseofilum reptotaenium CS-1145]OJJ27014.1 hypothetical protein BI308_02865 [Roseofilum reptotaenium AO1-A]